MERMLEGLGYVRGRAPAVPRSTGDFVGHLDNPTRIGVNGLGSSHIEQPFPNGVIALTQAIDRSAITYTEADRQKEFAQMYGIALSESARPLVQSLTRRFNKKGTTLRDGFGDWMRLSQVEGYDEVRKAADRANARARYWAAKHTEAGDARADAEREKARKIRQDFKSNIVQSSRAEVKYFKSLTREDPLSALEFVSNRSFRGVNKDDVIQRINSRYFQLRHQRLQEAPLLTDKEIATHQALTTSQNQEPFRRPAMEAWKPVEFIQPALSKVAAETQANAAEAAATLTGSTAALRESFRGIYHSIPPQEEPKGDSVWRRAIYAVKSKLPTISEITPQGRMRRAAILVGVGGLGAIVLNKAEPVLSNLAEARAARERDTELRKIDIKVGSGGTYFFDAKGIESIVKPEGKTQQQIREEGAIRIDRLRKIHVLIDHFAKKKGLSADNFRNEQTIDSAKILTDAERKMLLELNNLPISQQQEFDILFRRANAT